MCVHYSCRSSTTNFIIKFRVGCREPAYPGIVYHRIYITKFGINFLVIRSGDLSYLVPRYLSTAVPRYAMYPDTAGAVESCTM
jgi:hypothetical protein